MGFLNENSSKVTSNGSIDVADIEEVLDVAQQEIQRNNNETDRKIAEIKREQQEAQRQSNEILRDSKITEAVENLNLAKNDFSHKAEYNPETEYNKNNIVQYNGSSYIAIRNVLNVTPIDDNINWSLLAKKGEDGNLKDAVKSVNGIFPDENGNIVIQNQGGSGNVPNYLVEDTLDSTSPFNALSSKQGSVLNSLIQENLNALNTLRRKNISGFVAHRGLTSIAPENTLKAISEAGRRGFSMVEIDAMKLNDGTWILMHDDTVNRTTNGTGSTVGYTATTIKNLIIDTPSYQIQQEEIFKVPTLDEALKEISYWGMGVNLDGTKFSATKENIDYLLDQLRKYNLLEKSIVMCPSSAMRSLVANYSKDIAIGWTTVIANLENDIVEANKYKNGITLAYDSSLLTESVVYRLQSLNIGVYAYKADTYLLATKWENKGVDFIETDFLLPVGRFKK